MITYLLIWCRIFVPSTVGVREWADQIPATWFRDAFGRVQRDETVHTSTCITFRNCLLLICCVMYCPCHIPDEIYVQYADLFLKPQDYGWWYRFPGGLVWWQCRKVRQVYIPMIYRTGIYTYIVRGGNKSIPITTKFRRLCASMLNQWLFGMKETTTFWEASTRPQNQSSCAQVTIRKPIEREFGALSGHKLLAPTWRIIFVSKWLGSPQLGDLWSLWLLSTY